MREEVISHGLMILMKFFTLRRPSSHAHANMTKKVHDVNFWKLFGIVLINFAYPCVTRGSYARFDYNSNCNL